jgi:hypothetical protein
MPVFSRYVELAYEVADQKGFGSQLRGPGTQRANQRFMSQLADAYNANNHRQASEAAARQFFQERLGPP